MALASRYEAGSGWWLVASSGFPDPSQLVMLWKIARLGHAVKHSDRRGRCAAQRVVLVRVRDARRNQVDLVGPQRLRDPVLVAVQHFHATRVELCPDSLRCVTIPQHHGRVDRPVSAEYPFGFDTERF